MITDTDRIEALEAMGNLAIWQGTWSPHVTSKCGQPIRSVSAMDADGRQVGKEIATGQTLREALDAWIVANKNAHQPRSSEV